MTYQIFHHFLLCLCFIFISCGKSVKNNEASSTFLRAPAVSTDSIFVRASIQGVKSVSSSRYFFDRDAFVEIPSALHVTEGNAGNQYAKLYFSYLDDSYDFYCLYKGGASSPSPETEAEMMKGQKYNFEACYTDIDLDGRADYINYQPYYRTPQDRSTYIYLEVKGADPRFDTTVKAFLTVDWL